MTDNVDTPVIESQFPRRLLEVLDGFMRRSTNVHRSILDNQAAMIEALSKLTDHYPAKQHPVFSRQQLEEFAEGSIAGCFGPDYAVLDQRPAPRIPNGRLLLMDRVTEVAGKRMEFASPASITTEVDIKPDAWYLRTNAYTGIPLAILMEMALQPCGMLSAYLGTSLAIPPENYLFRNLDGWISLKSLPDLEGKTVANRAELIKSVSSSGLYIQTYHFSLSAKNVDFLEGESSFGYFTPTVMGNQSGLDLGNGHPKVMDEPGFPAGFTEITHTQTPTSLLDLSGKLWINPAGGKFGWGVVIGQRDVSPDDWYFKNHFKGDPVMPGSLGVEAIVRGLAHFFRRSSGNNSSVTLEFLANEPLRWKYRGQVLPINRQTYFEAHIKRIDTDAGSTRFLTDADFWVDGLRIYTIENLSLILREGLEEGI